MNSRLSVNHSYFYDALSGNFKPPSDPQARTHTLGRLLTATFEKGIVTNPHSHAERRIYRPSWAPVDSIVHISHWDLRSLTLTAEERELQLIHALEGKQHRNLRVFDTATGTEPVVDEPLSHEFDYTGLQERVRLIAQDFFNTFGGTEVVPVTE